MKPIRLVHDDPWPESLSDGLTLPCGLCGRVPIWDYTMDSGLWNRVVPSEHRRGVVCLECFVKLPGVTADLLAYGLTYVQMTGMPGLTIVLQPTAAFWYDWKCPTAHDDGGMTR